MKRRASIQLNSEMNLTNTTTQIDGDWIQSVAEILALAYLRLLRQKSTNSPNNGHLAPRTDSPVQPFEPLDSQQNRSDTCAGRESHNTNRARS